MIQLSQCISENEGHLTEIKSMLNQEKQQNKDLTDSVQELKEQMKKESKQAKDEYIFLIRGGIVFNSCFW